MPKAPPVYSNEQSTQLGEKLKRMAAHPKGLLLRDLVQAHKTKIQAALNAGYSYDDIIAAFGDLGIPIKPNTLKQYLRDTNASSPKHKSKKPSSEPISSAPAAIDKDPQADVGSADATQPSSSPDTISPTESRPANTDERGFQRMRSDDEL